MSHKRQLPDRPRRAATRLADVAGVIVEAGPGVRDLHVGDEVLGTADGALAEYARLPLHRLVRKPAALSFIQLRRCRSPD